MLIYYIFKYNDATKNFENSFIKSITYEGSYTTETVSSYQIDDWLKENCSSTNPIRTRISRLYDIVFLFDIPEGSTNKYLYALEMLFGNYNDLGGFVFVKKIANTWESGQSGYQSLSMYDYFKGPYIEYGVAPKPFVKYRVIRENNAYYIDRYVDISDSKYDDTNISYQILYRNKEPHKYLVYGIDLKDNLSNL